MSARSKEVARRYRQARRKREVVTSLSNTAQSLWTMFARGAHNGTFRSNPDRHWLMVVTALMNIQHVVEVADEAAELGAADLVRDAAADALIAASALINDTVIVLHREIEDAKKDNVIDIRDRLAARSRHGRRAPSAKEATR